MSVPCCHICLQAIKPGERVVWSKSLALLFHEKCNHYHPAIIDDRGEYEVVVSRNAIFKELVHAK
jgi:hypothetical protein